MVAIQITKAAVLQPDAVTVEAIHLKFPHRWTDLTAHTNWISSPGAPSSLCWNTAELDSSNSVHFAPFAVSRRDVQRSASDQSSHSWSFLSSVKRMTAAVRDKCLKTEHH